MRPSIWIALALAGCASPAILGGPTPATTSHACSDGTRCPNGYDCPALEGGRCEASGMPPAGWGPTRLGEKTDAGGGVQTSAPLDQR